MTCAECKYLDTDDYSNGKYWCTYHRTYVWPTDQGCGHFWEDRYRSTSEIDRLTSNNSGACIITMACKKALGELFSDTCDELMIIRNARELFRGKKQGEISEYYQKSPAVVSGINNSSNKDELFCNVYQRLVKPLVVSLKRGELEEAYNIYRIRIDELFSLYCV